MKTTKTIVAVLAATFALGACASERAAQRTDKDAAKLELYRAHAGAPVNSFLGRVNSWTSLGENALAVWVSPNRGYLLEVTGYCAELPWAQAITISNGPFQSVSRFDDVVVLDRGSNAIPCPIREIRPLDGKAIREAERAARAQASR
ncbi:DUF6491 family protein [Lysobacter fragariae]